MSMSLQGAYLQDSLSLIGTDHAPRPPCVTSKQGGPGSKDKMNQSRPPRHMVPRMKKRNRDNGVIDVGMLGASPPLNSAPKPLGRPPKSAKHKEKQNQVQFAPPMLGQKQVQQQPVVVGQAIEAQQEQSALAGENGQPQDQGPFQQLQGKKRRRKVFDASSKVVSCCFTLTPSRWAWVTCGRALANVRYGRLG